MLRCLLLASRNLVANRAAVRGVSLATTEGTRKISYQGAVLSSSPPRQISSRCSHHLAIFRATTGISSLARQEQARPRALTRAVLTYYPSFWTMRRQSLMTHSKDVVNLRLSRIHNSGVQCARSFWSAGRGVGGGGTALTRAVLTYYPSFWTMRRQSLMTHSKDVVNLRLSRIHNSGVQCARSFWSAGRGVGGGGGGGGHPLSEIFNTFKRVGGALAVPFVVAWKYKMAALSALKLTKLSSLASLAMTTAGYAWLFGVPYGVGVTVQILIHESGHALALMRYGVPFQPMVFVPFMGAYVAHAGILSAWRNAMVALAGPGAGFVAAFALYVAGVMVSSSSSLSSPTTTTNRSSLSPSEGRIIKALRVKSRHNGRGGEEVGAGIGQNRISQLLHALADFGCMINLFNLLPIGTLDGGQVAATLHPSLLVLGCVAGTAMVYNNDINNPIVYLILLGGYYQVAARLMGWETLKPGAVNLSPRGKAVVAAAYIGLAAALACLSSLNQAQLYGPRGEAPGVAFRDDSPYAAEFDRIVKELPDI